MEKKTRFDINYLGDLVATIVRADHKVEKLEFVTSDLNPLQVGFHNQKKGVKLTPHIHISNTKVIDKIQEVLYIIEGKVKVTFYTIDGDTIDSVILSGGDTLVQISMGHGFEMLEPTKIMEVKQGPYPGTQHAKIYFKDDQKI
jgi:cupin fold WbuC family metalloprotein